jgi:glycosyltransferase involved in cell wall biosynthesis
MKAPKISVILPCYNVEPYIGKCLDSLLAQTLSDIEIICVDDKSTDDTVSVVSEYMSRDKRIKLISQPKNMGAGVARNTGRDMARGKYVSFIDPDDWVDENFYCELYRRASESDLDVVKAGMIYEYVETNETYTSTLNQLIKQNSMFFYGEHANAIYKLSFLNDNNIYYPTDVMTGQDAVFLSALVLANPKMDVVDSVFYHYFIERPGSLDSRKLGHKKVLSRIKMLDYKAEFLSNAKKLNDTDRQIYIEKHIFEHFIGAYHKEKEQSDDNKLLFDWLICLMLNYCLNIISSTRFGQFTKMILNCSVCQSTVRIFSLKNVAQMVGDTFISVVSRFCRTARVSAGNVFQP